MNYSFSSQSNYRGSMSPQLAFASVCKICTFFFIKTRDYVILSRKADVWKEILLITVITLH